MSDNKLFTILSAATLLLCILVYANHFNNEFHFDDFHTINDNPSIRSLKNLPDFFTDPSTTSVLPSHQSYRPGLTALNAIDYAVYETWKGWFPETKLKMQTPFHWSIFILFLIQGFFMFLLFRKLFDLAKPHHWNRYIALFGTAVYLLHTANAETINYIIQRADSFSTAMVVIALVTFIYRPAWRVYGIYLIPFILGMLVKEPALMFLPILFIYLVLFEHQPEFHRFADFFSKYNTRIYLKALKTLIPGIIPGIFFLYLSLVALRPETWVASTYHWFDYLATQPWVILRYFISFFLPINLSADSDWGLIPLTDERTLIGILFIVASIFVLLKYSGKKEYHPALFGMWWFYFALIPSSSVISLAEVTNDHRMFFPFVGLALTFSWLPGLYVMRNEEVLRQDLKKLNLITLLAIGIPVLLAIGTFQRNRVWHNSESLWYDVSVKSPRNGRGLMNYGLTLMAKNDLKGALEVYNRALQHSPNYSFLHINLAICKSALNMPLPEIEDHYMKATRFGADYYGGYHHYGNWLWRQGRIQEAIGMLQQAIVKAPLVNFSRNSLMQLYYEQQMWPELNVLATETLSLTPGDTNAEWYLKASESKGVEKNEAYYINLGLNQYNSQQYDEAIKSWEEALKLNPRSAIVYNNIGSAYNAMKEYRKAIPFLEKALEIDPNFTLAHNNLKEAQKHLN